MRESRNENLFGGFLMKTLITVMLTAMLLPTGAVAQTAAEIIRETNFTGGLIVHLGCGDGKLTAALSVNDRCLVHGLDIDPDAVKRAREHIQKVGLYGKVSVQVLKGANLPYADNLVNLLVVTDRGQVSREEGMRVLAPGGLAYIKRANGWRKVVKARGDSIDEWTHHLHDAGGNAVASDRVVGPPQRLQWTAGPVWARSHGWTPSVSAMVSAAGRIFYICDESLACVDGTVPSKWFLVARDAFSGVLLWKCPVPNWGSEEFSGTPDNAEGVPSVGRFTMPPNAGKRLVAIGYTVYVTLGPEAPITALDAATGRKKRVYTDTARADEILCVDGRLIVSINPSERPDSSAVRKGNAPPPAPGKHVCAVDTETGRVLWKKGPFSPIRATLNQDPFGRLELAAGDGKVFVLTKEAIECLDARSGDRLWRKRRPTLPSGAVTRMGYSGMFEYLLEVMVYNKGVVLLAQPEPNTHHTYHTMPGTLYAFAADDGRQMWKHAYGAWGHCTPPDVFVIDDVVWSHVNADTEFGSVWGKGYKAKDSSIVDYRIQALDLRSGELRREIATRDIFNVGHHHRCYRNKITERFLLSCYQNHWVRSGCLLGYLPCNGLLYVTPHPCGCYISAKLTGFNALAPRDKRPQITTPESERLVKGPAYGQIKNRQSKIENPNDWPTYRHDGRRSGATESAVSTELGPAWRTNIGSRPSAVVIADGKLLVAGVDTHTVYALNADNGEKLWKYSADSRIDSPPTVRGELALFGSADGQVYCLRADDGELAWRFDAAPNRRLLTAFGQLESPWPVPGSVLLHDGRCWFAAGRSSHLDGGIHVYSLDPATGKVASAETIYNPDPETGRTQPEPSANTMAGLLNDIPGTDRANVFIRQMQVASCDGPTAEHLYTSGGYLDSSWFNRTFWQAGRAMTSGLMVLGKD
ncbi:MAG: outer membrane protein assembly factor BamB family protein, partial [Planctomycetota bacterium]